MQTQDGCLLLFKRQRGNTEGAEILVPPAAIVAIEPHRTGCYVYVAGHKFDVTHSHTEIAQAVNAAMRGR